MIDTLLLKSQMVLRGISVEALAKAQGWSLSTAYRKLSGAVLFSVKEMQICISLLHMELEMAGKVFFPEQLS